MFVRNYFKSRVKAYLVAWFGSSIGVDATYVSNFVVASMDPGSYIARRIDAIDRGGITGYIEY